MPIPYMGSKRKSAQMICNTILNYSPDCKNVVDLFCGGFAVGEWFVKKGINVRANDLNTHVIALLNQTVNIGLDEKKCTEFVTQEMFKDVQKNPQNYEPWYIGYVQCVWSFGNNQKGYLFGKETEPIKYAGHELVINKNPEYLLNLFPNFPKKYIDGILKQKDWHTRRIALVKVAKLLKDRRLELQQLEQLERLQQLQQLPKIEFTSLSYENVIIKSNDVIYCDPPYKGTAEYKEGAFNHDVFWEWVRKISKTNKIFISEYTAPEDFKSILEFTQKSTLQGGQQQHNNQPTEKLFILK